MEQEEVKAWEISIGFYPGILFGVRTYYTDNLVTYVFYLPFVDIAVVRER
jgi:hypothetical protein